MPAASTRFLLRDGDVSLPREGSQLLDERRMHAAARSGATACVLKDEHELLVTGDHLQDQLDAPDGRVLLIRQPHPEPVPRRCLGPGRRVAARRLPWSAAALSRMRLADEKAVSMMAK